MMRLHHFCRLCAALNNIRVDGSLSKEIDSLQFPCFLLKHTNKLAANNFALLFRVCHILKFAKETLRGIHINQVCMQFIAEHFRNTFRFVFAHQTMVDMYAHKLLSDRFDQHCRYNRRIHAARQSQKHFPITNLLSDQFHLIFNEVLHVPICLSPALLENKLFQSFLSRKLCELGLTFRLRVIYGNHRHAHIIKLWSDFHVLSVNHAVFTAV